jgi:cellulose synthase (UDP-forming)
MKQRLKNWIDDVLGRKTYQRYGEKEKRKQRISGQLFTIAVFIAAVCYLTWCVFNAQWQYWYVTIPFLVTEFVFLILFLLWANILWSKRFHRPEGPALEKKDFSVDVFIPVCREPIDIIEETIAAAVSIDYDNKKVYILDDGEDDAVKAMSEKYGVQYIRRPSHENTKAGNLNYALERTTGDLVLAIDADQVAKPEIIDRIIGYFTLPKIAFVQTKQDFKLPDGDPWGNADVVFYEVMEPGKDYDNAAISCGSGVMYRRAALESVDGFSIWNLVEDLHTSLMLHSKGWRSVYHQESYTKGTAPEEVVSYVKQRWQWAVDSLRMLFWNNPLFLKGLNFHQRLQYFHFGFNYIAFGIFLPVFFILPIWALFTHQFMLAEPFWHYAVARLPYFLLYMIFNKIATDRTHSFKIFQAQAGLFATYFNAFFKALLSKSRIPKYTVTRKTALQPGIWSRFFRCLPHIVFVLTSLTAVVYGFITIRNDSWFLIVNVFWAFWTVSVLWRFIALSLRPKRIIR